MMNPPDIKADARRAFEVLKAGGVGLLPGSGKKRGAHKRHPTLGSLELERQLHIMEPYQVEIVKTLTQDLGLPLAVVAKYDENHPVIKNLDAERLDASTSNGTIHMAINVGAFADELTRLAHAENILLQGSSANPTGTGNRFRLEDVPEEIRKLADISIDYGLSPWWIHGLGSTIIDCSGPDLDIVRIGACYDVIKDVVRRFWGIGLPSDPGRASVPHGNLKTLPPSESLKKLTENSAVD